MIVIERIYQKKKRKFKVYTKAEADDNKNISYTFWQDTLTGGYALTNDDHVMECLSRSEYTDKNGSVKTFIKLTGGVGWKSPSSKINFTLNHSYKTYSKANPAKTWDEYEIKSTRGVNTINTYASMMLNGKIDFNTLGNVYRPDSKIPQATVRRFLKNKRVKMEVEKKVKEILLDKAINKEFAVDNIVKALDMAESKGDVGNFLKANDHIMDLLEMKPNKMITTDTVELIDTKLLLDQITQEEQRKVVLQRKEERDEPMDE